MNIIVPTKRSLRTGKLIPALAKKDAGWKQLVKLYPEHKEIWDARIAVKNVVETTKTQRFLTASNSAGKLPIPMKYYAAHTGRFGGGGKTNMLNLPRKSELRSCLQAPEGMYVYAADLANIESRMLAWLAGQEDLLTSFRAGKDVYCEFAEKIYRKTITKEANPEERFIGKTAVLGLGYGMGIDKFKDTLEAADIKFPPELPEQIVQLYRNDFRNISDYWKRVKGVLFTMIDPTRFDLSIRFGPLIIERHKLLMPNGMYLNYPGLQFDQDSNSFNFETYGRNSKVQFVRTYGGKITENIVQALSRIIITDAMLRLQQSLKPFNGTICHVIHDEILVVAPKDGAEEINDLIVKEMCTRPVWAEDLPLDATSGYSEFYSKA